LPVSSSAIRFKRIDTFEIERINALQPRRDSGVGFGLGNFEYDIRVENDHTESCAGRPMSLRPSSIACISSA
jgi:hypothetical protein